VRLLLELLGVVSAAITPSLFGGGGGTIGETFYETDR